MLDTNNISVTVSWNAGNELLQWIYLTEAYWSTNQPSTILKKFDVIINAIIYWISITSALKFEYFFSIIFLYFF